LNSKDAYFNYLSEKINNLLEEIIWNKKFLRNINWIKEDGNVNKIADITEIKLQKLEKTLNQIKESTLLENSNIITYSE